MGPPSYMRSVVDRNVVMRRVPVINAPHSSNHLRVIIQLRAIWLSYNRRDAFHVPKQRISCSPNDISRPLYG
jgi:hypothetical protein